MADPKKLIARLRGGIPVGKFDDDTWIDWDEIKDQRRDAADALECLSAPVEGIETTEEERAALKAFMVEMGHTDDGETFALAQTASRLLRDFARLQAEVARLRALLPKTGDTTKDGMDAVADGPAPPDAGFTNEEKPVNQIKHLHERLSGEARRIAELERERDEEKADAASAWATAEATLKREQERIYASEAEAARLRKAVKDIAECRLYPRSSEHPSTDDYADTIKWMRGIATAALQPEPGADE